MKTTKVKALTDFTMGNQSLKKDEEVNVEDWRAERLAGEGLVIILSSRDAEEETPVEEAPKKASTPSKKPTKRRGK